MPKTGGAYNHIKNTAELFNNRRGLLRMLSDVFHGRYSMSLLTSLMLLFGLAYILLPFDFDWIPLIGWIDDGFVGYWVIKRLLNETKRHARFMTLNNKDNRNDEVQDAIVID